jgi:4-amino-4-deoxy-L-arabinose transferase-like glycosyltransferase
MAIVDVPLRVSSGVRWRRLRLTGSVLLIVALAFGLRAYAVGWGLPYTEHPDEPSAANRALGMLRREDWNPQFFGKPSLYYYALRLVFDAHVSRGIATGAYTSIADLPYTTDQYLTTPDLFVWGRMLTVVLGTLTVALVCALGWRRWGWSVGLIGAALLATSPFHMRHSQYISQDVPSALMALIALWTAVRIVEPRTRNTEPRTENPKLRIENRELRTEANGTNEPTNQRTNEPTNQRTNKPAHLRCSLFPVPCSLFPVPLWRDYALAGLAVGLATSTKYNAVFTALAVVMAHALVWRGASLRQSPQLVWAAAWSVIGFAIGTPYALLHWNAFVGQALGQYSAYSAIDSGDAAHRWPLLDYAAFFWNDGLRPLPLLAALVGIAAVIIRRDRIGLVLLAFVLPYPFFFLSQQVHFFRNMLPIIPPLLLLAGYGVVTLADVYARRHNQGWVSHGWGRLPFPRRVLLLVFTLCLLAAPATSAIGLTQFYAQPHSKVRAGLYVRDELPRGAPIAVALNPVQWANQPLIVPFEDHVERPEWYRSQGYRYMIVNTKIVDRAGYLALRSHAEVVATFPGDLDGQPGPPMEALDLGLHLDELAIERREAVFGERLQLLGFQRGAGEIRAPYTPLNGERVVRYGQALLLNLYWQPLAELDTDYAIFLHLRDADGRVVAQRDTVMRVHDYPSSRWQPGELIIDLADLAIPSGTPPGEYALVLGVYQMETMERLTLPGVGDGALVLTIVTVSG